MPLKLRGVSATWTRLEVFASLLSYAIADYRSNAEEVFNDYGYYTTRPDERIPLKDRASLSFAEFSELFELFRSSGIDAAIENGIFGTSARSDNTLGVYANAKGAEIVHAALNSSPVLRRFNFKIIDTPNAISFAAQTVNVSGGGSVSPLPGKATGTMGAWLEETQLGFVGLSNNHVISEFNAFGKGTAVIQPGASDGGSSTDVIAHVEDFVRLSSYNASRPTSTVNTADVAWCKPAPGKNVSKDIGNVPLLPTGECDLDHDIATFNTPIDVQLYGKQSKWMQGQAVAISSTWMRQNPYSPALYRFRDQIELNLNAVTQGDSGAIVMRASDKKIGGILFAIGGPGVGFASPWSEVLRCSRLQFRFP
jgi:hypothetical protein